jgi:hypothetical protein
MLVAKDAKNEETPMLRPALSRLALLAFVLIPALVAAAGTAPAKAQQQFIDRSVIDVPLQAGKFTLTGAQIDPKNVLYGAETAWSAEGAPRTLALNVFVYPLGEGDEVKVVQQQSEQVEAGVEAAEKQGDYSEVQVGERTPFLIVRAESTVGEENGARKKAFDPVPRPEPEEQTKNGDNPPDPDTDAILNALARNTSSPNSHGLRQAFSFNKGGVPTRSLSYVFHRHLFGFKIRASVPESDMDQASFEALADEAARWLVPQISVLNIGDCGVIEVPVPDKGADDKAMAAIIIAGAAKVGNNNCSSKEDPKATPPNGTRRLVIDYPADTWKSN